MTDLRIEALDYARRLAATLEQYNADPHTKQVEALRAELDRVRLQLQITGNAAAWAVGVLRGEPVPPRIPGVPISLLETAASEARTKIAEQAREINSRDNQIDQMAADIAKLTSRASIAEAASRGKDKELAEFRKANDTAIAILDEAQFSTLTPDDYNNNPLLREIAQRVMGGAEARDKLTVLESATGRAVAILNGDPCPPPLFGEPLSVIEEAALSAKGAARRADEIGRVQRDLSEARAELAKAHDRIHQLEQTRDQQVGAERLRERLTEANDELAYAYNIIKNRNMRLPDSSYKTDLLNEIAGLVDRDVRREIGADLAGIKQQLFIANGTITKQAREIDSLRADLRKGQKVKDFVNDECQKIRAALGLGRMAQAPEVLAAIEDLRNDSRMLEGTASALRGRLQDSERDAEARADVIKELHAQYHELEARKQGVQFDLDRAKEEIEFAEAEIAKYKPLIEAVKHEAVLAWHGHWVPLREFATDQSNADLPDLIELTARYYTGDIQWL